MCLLIFTLSKFTTKKTLITYKLTTVDKKEKPPRQERFLLVCSIGLVTILQPTMSQQFSSRQSYWYRSPSQQAFVLHQQVLHEPDHP